MKRFCEDRKDGVSPYDRKMNLENELINCKSRIQQLETANRRLEIQQKNYQNELKEKQAELDSFEDRYNKRIIKCKVLEFD